jgi:hypothetical protein
MTDARDNWRPVARRLWVWPVAILVSFPIGGYLADLVVNGVDSVGTALIGGLIAGAIIGAAEWFALRRWVSWLWIAATSVGMAAGLTAGAALVDYGISRGDLLLMGAVHRGRCRGPAGAGIRTTPGLRRILVGAWEPTGLGAWLARDLVCDLEKRQGAVHELRRGRSARLRTADMALPRSLVPGD